MRPLVIAHRGASGECPENTYTAFDRALEQSADMIETDLHLTRDGVVVIHHDSDLRRLGADGEIGTWSAEELAGLNAAPGSPTIERLPTLLGLLERYGERMAFNLELKVGPEEEPYAGLEAIVLEALEARGLLERMLLSCFDDRVLERLRRLSASARLAALFSPRASKKMIVRAQRVGAEAIHPHVSLVDPGLVERAHQAGLRVYPYTANDLPEMKRLLDCGVDGIITNYPQRLHDLIDARENA